VAVGWRAPARRLVSRSQPCPSSENSPNGDAEKPDQRSNPPYREDQSKEDHGRRRGNELLQLYVPGRYARLSDFIVDATAAVLGVLVGCIPLRTWFVFDECDFRLRRLGAFPRPRAAAPRAPLAALVSSCGAQQLRLRRRPTLGPTPLFWEQE
jgi:hypothetical protein